MRTRLGGEMLKGAIVGFGFIAAKGHHPAYLGRDDVEIVAIADVSPARLDAARAGGEVRAGRDPFGPHRQGTRGDVEHLSYDARERRSGVADGLAPRPEDFRRRHRHGSREPQLLPDVRVAGIAADSRYSEDAD